MPLRRQSRERRRGAGLGRAHGLRGNTLAGALVFDAGSKLTLRGGRVSGNKLCGVCAHSGGTVMVAEAEEGRHQTVSEGHRKKGNWVDKVNAGASGKFEGLAAGPSRSSH